MEREDARRRDAARRRPPNVPYYGWRATEPLKTSEPDLQNAVSTPTDPYNDFHGVPGTSIGDSEDQKCP